MSLFIHDRRSTAYEKFCTFLICAVLVLLCAFTLTQVWSIARSKPEIIMHYVVPEDTFPQEGHYEYEFEQPESEPGKPKRSPEF